MPANDEAEKAVRTELHEEAGGRARLVLRGTLDAETTGPCWRELERRLRPRRVTALEVDASQLELEGAIGMALLRFLLEGGMTRGAPVTIRGLHEQFQELLDTFTGEDFRAYRPKGPPKIGFLERIGRSAHGLGRELVEQLAFIGSVMKAIPFVLSHPKRLRWGEILQVMKSAGVNALPVVFLFSWLIGVVLALEAAEPLAQFGAQLYIADMIGFSSVRDTGPIVTAIMLAGRSGSAFAAELGTMKVNQELDALTTMGLDPVRFLVVQRVLAALFLTPVLSLYAMLAGIIGGVMVMDFLGFPWIIVYHQIVNRVHVTDLIVGLTKALIFGVIVGGVGCLRGLQTQEGPAAVGASATRSVVSGIILIIVADTLYSMAQYFFSHAG